MPNPKAYAALTIVLCALLVIVDSVDGQAAEVDANLKNSTFISFDKYVELFNKTYSPQQFSMRKQIYEEKQAELKRKIESGEIGYRVGPTSRSDWTEEERARTKNLKVKEFDNAQNLISHASLKQSAGNPSSLDWRQRGVITSIKNQGNCGSCWTFATCGYGESRLIIQGKRNLSIDLSEQYLLSCTPQCDCEGGYLEYVFDESADGIPLEADAPYNPYGYKSPSICWTSPKIIIGHYPQSAYRVRDSYLESLLQVSPVTISISATNWEDYTGGIFTCRYNDKVNHAVLLIGYTPDYWIVKNQWGTNWGQDGFIRISRSPNSNCQIGSSVFWMSEPVLSFCIAAIGLLILAFIN